MISRASDSLHYDVSAVGLEVTSDFLVDVKYDPLEAQRQRNYALGQSRRELELSGLPEDRVEGSDTERFVAELDTVFARNYGFTLTHLVQLLACLSHWAQTSSSEDAGGICRATKDRMIALCAESLEIPEEEAAQAIEFVTLDPSRVVGLFGQSTSCEEIPIWEVARRKARYGLHPLVKVGDDYLWGPVATEWAGRMWCGSLGHGALPIRLDSAELTQTLQDEKSRLSKLLVQKGAEVLRRFTDQVEADVELHRRDKDGGHPAELGDYDLLAFIPKANEILAIECKDTLPALALKDVRTLKERLFGRGGSGSGSYVAKVTRRTEYLRTAKARVAQILGWPTAASSAEVVPVYVSRIDHWWTKYPPMSVDCAFVRIDQLDEFVRRRLAEAST